MRGERLFPRPLSERAAQPFTCAEEAWLWFARCQQARMAGVRFTADCGDVARPCDPDDVYRAMDRLYRRGRIGDGHVTVLGRFGLRLSPPDPWGGDTPGEAALWAEAMERLGVLLREKGIVA